MRNDVELLEIRLRLVVFFVIKTLWYCKVAICSSLFLICEKVLENLNTTALHFINWWIVGHTEQRTHSRKHAFYRSVPVSNEPLTSKQAMKTLEYSHIQRLSRHESEGI